MIVVDMQLRSAISSARDANLCRVEIANTGEKRGARHDYVVRLYARNDGRLIRTAHVRDWPRDRHPAWRLLGAALDALEAAT